MWLNCFYYFFLLLIIAKNVIQLITDQITREHRLAINFHREQPLSFWSMPKFIILILMSIKYQKAFLERYITFPCRFSYPLSLCAVRRVEYRSLCTIKITCFNMALWNGVKSNQNKGLNPALVVNKFSAGLFFNLLVLLSWFLSYCNNNCRCYWTQRSQIARDQLSITVITCCYSRSQCTTINYGVILLVSIL